MPRRCQRAVRRQRKAIRKELARCRAALRMKLRGGDCGAGYEVRGWIRRGRG